MPTRQEPVPASPGSGPLEKSFYRCLLVAALYILLTLPFLGRPALFDPDEGYYPETAREMMKRDNWLDPVFNGEPRWGKPVGFYLADCVSFRLFGFSEWSARLPSLLAGLGLVLVSMALGVRLYGSRVGLYSGVIAATALQPVVYSRAAVPDMLLSFFVALALYGFVLGAMDRNGSRGARAGFFLAYAGSALAFLAKGPLGVLLPGITAAGYLVLSGNHGRILKLKPGQGILLFFLLAAPWFIYMTALHGTVFLEEIFLQRNLIRYFTNKWQHPGPFYYYLPIVFAGAFPWSIALLWGLALSLRQSAAHWRKAGKTAAQNPDLFILCWFFGMLVFFSLSRSKLSNYVLPLYPAAALFASLCLDQVERSGSRLRFLLLAGGTALLAALLFAPGSFILADKLKVASSTIITGFSPLALIVLGILTFPFQKSLKLWLGSCCAGMALLVTLLTGFVIPRIDSFQAVKTLSLEHLNSLRRDERVAVIGVRHPSLLFYTGRLIFPFDPKTDRWEDARANGIRWVLTRESALGELKEKTGVQPAEVYRMGGRALVRFAEKEENGGGERAISY